MVQPNVEGGDLERYQKYLRAYEYNKRDEETEGQQADQYYHDKQWSEHELEILRKRNQPPVVDNALKRKIDFLTGTEERMRRDPKAFPRTPKHENDADTATATIRYVCDRNHWETLSSDVMRNGLIRGRGGLFCGIEPDAKGQNDVMLRWVDPARFFYDPRSVAPDFNDARFLGEHVWQDIDEAKEQNPQQADQLEQLLDYSKGSLATMPVEQDQAQQWADLEKRRVRIVNIYERRLVPPFMKAQWHFCKFSGNVVLQAMVSPYMDADGQYECPYLFWSPYVDEKGDRYGIIRSMKTMQDEINHRRSRALHELNNRQIWTAQEGIIEDVEEFKRESNKPDGVLQFKHGEFNKEFGFVDRSEQLKGQFDLLQHSIARMENYGPNPGLVGQGEGVADASGRALLAQRDSGMTELSPVFTRHRNWKLRVYRAIWGRVRQAWTAERWINVTDDENSVQFIGLNQYQTVIDPNTGMPSIQGQNLIAQIDVDIILEEGPDVIVMQEELMQTFAQLGEAAAGPLGKILIQLSNVPKKEQLLTMLDQATQPPPEIAAMQQQMAKLESMLAAANIDKVTSEVEKNRADTIQKLTAAFTQPAPTVHEDKLTGQTSVLPAPPPPDLNQAFAVMQQMPFSYMKPTPGQLDQMSAMAGGPMPGQEQPIDGGQLQDEGMPPDGAGAMMQDMQPGMLPTPGQPMPDGMPMQ